ncbi:AzlC family ABC transporter permease [Arcobacter sp. F2176]|uniref:AzlC family ABC transporter permease n=1 Tax=Arcobacter sp. F2176 TaxID=2044511 RepID=UPI00100AFEC7|nr:AzlC family ABC transporter permease [Arcobacter sp. F2176]RXJ82588.1 branched-chain amino acid transporter AzlC [Arcobacter sp. F2176]
MIKSKEFKTALKVSIPVMMGYCVLGFAFGLLITSLDYPWYLALLMSIFIYAGALQFLAIGFFSSKLGLIDIFITSIFVNIRQSFYGLSMLKKFKKSGKLKPYLIFGLTDETYALLTSIKDDEQLKKKYYYLYLCGLNQFYWVIGTLLGAVFGTNISFDTKGLDFSLTALFVILAIEQYKTNKNITPFVIGAVTSILAIILVPINNMLIFAIVCSLLGMFILRKRLNNDK